MQVILPCLALVDAEFSKPVLQYRQVPLSLCTIHVYSVVRSSDHGNLSRKNTFDHMSLSNKETIDVLKELDGIDKKFDGARGS